MNSCEAKHKKSLAHHFTSSSGSTDINALHDAYGAYVQFIALSTRFVINPSMLTFRARAFVPNVLLKMLSLFLFIFSRIFLSSEGDPKREREKERGGRESSSSQVYRSQTREFTHTCYEKSHDRRSRRARKCALRSFTGRRCALVVRVLLFFVCFCLFVLFFGCLSCFLFCLLLVLFAFVGFVVFFLFFGRDQRIDQNRPCGQKGVPKDGAKS